MALSCGCNGQLNLFVCPPPDQWANHQQQITRGIVEQLLARGLDERQIVEELYLRVFTRLPEPPEFAE